MTRQSARGRRHQVETLRAYLRLGSIKEAAEELGIAETTARQRLIAYYRAHGYKNAAQAAYALDRPTNWRPQ